MRESAEGSEMDGQGELAAGRPNSAPARFLWGAAVAVAAKGFALAFHAVPFLSLLGTTSVGFDTAGLLFGWPALGAAGLVEIAYLEARHQPRPALLVVTVLAYVVAGAITYEGFRRLRGIGRGMPNLRSLAWFSALSAAGGLLSSGAIAALARHTDLLSAMAVWTRSTVVSVWVFVPALLVLADRFARRRLVPIPAEVAAAPPALGGAAPATGMEAEPSLRQTLLVGLALLTGLTVTEALLSRRAPELRHWLDLCYLVPIHWAAVRHRLAGGLLAAGAVGFCVLLSRAWELSWSPPAPAQALEAYAELLLFWLVGALLGAAQLREVRLRGQLAASNRRLRRDLERVVEALCAAVEAKDLYTEGHLRRVTDYAHRVGGRLGLPAHDLEQLQIASALHDIGKIGIPESILNKSGPLLAAEQDLMQRHPEIGARILGDIDGMEEAAALVLYHQERFDGLRTGTFPAYPEGRTGEDIPLGSRIIAVVDAFDAMTTDRPYRGARTIEQAIATLRDERGAQFDPRVVDAFLEVLDERPWNV